MHGKFLYSETQQAITKISKRKFGISCFSGKCASRKSVHTLIGNFTLSTRAIVDVSALGFVSVLASVCVWSRDRVVFLVYWGECMIDYTSAVEID